MRFLQKTIGTLFFAQRRLVWFWFCSLSFRHIFIYFVITLCLNQFEAITISAPIVRLAVSGKLSTKEVARKGTMKMARYLTPFQNVFLYEYFILCKRILIGNNNHLASPRNALKFWIDLDLLYFRFYFSV
jgi:hypothetical protein